jgi:ABC-type bacteriocin/lantibiotic exporter with double-glycine peptidase domain
MYLFPGQGFDTSLGDMAGAVPKLGLKAQCRNMSVSDLRREHPLGVLHIDETHFVAIVGYEVDTALIVDSLYKGEDEPVRWLWGDVGARWDGAILVVSKR